MIFSKLVIPLLFFFTSSWSLPFSPTSSSTPLSYSKCQDRPQVSQEELNRTLPRLALFNRLAYCSAGVIFSWTCGGPCEALDSVEVFHAGGDDGAIPGYIVVYDKTSNAIVVAHQGTEKSKFLSILNDVRVDLVTLNPSYFPSAAGTDIKVHEGFQATFERTAHDIRSIILDVVLPQTGATRVITTGHSLGGAVAIFEGLMMTEALKDMPVQVETRVFGLPRTGNDKWASWIESTLGSNFSFITNQNDPIPRVPFAFQGYTHPSNEIHVRQVDANGYPIDVIRCNGREDELCSTGKGVFDWALRNHNGPYLGDIWFGAEECPL